MSEWISVEEKRPDFAVLVKVFREDGSVDEDMIQPVGSYSAYFGGVSISGKPDVTHWQPLPKPPDQE